MSSDLRSRLKEIRVRDGRDVEWTDDCIELVEDALSELAAERSAREAAEKERDRLKVNVSQIAEAHNAECSSGNELAKELVSQMRQVKALQSRLSAAKEALKRSFQHKLAVEAKNRLDAALTEVELLQSSLTAIEETLRDEAKHFNGCLCALCRVRAVLSAVSPRTQEEKTS